MTLTARNIDNGTVLAHDVTVARDRLSRAVGLLRHSRLEPGDGLLILPCRGVHTCGMRFAIDVLALDGSGVVVDAVRDLQPWRLRLPRRGAVGVLELPAGSLARSNTREGDRIALESRGQTPERDDSTWPIRGDHHP